LGHASFLINAVEIATPHSTTYKLKNIILHSAIVLIIGDVNVVDVVVVVGIVVILVVVIVVVAIVVAIVVVITVKKITVQHDLNMLFCNNIYESI
jgi:hypothetical protein